MSTICLVTGSVSDVVASLGFSASGRPASLGNVGDDESLLDQHGSWTSVLQVYATPTDELLASLSGHDRVACLYKSVNEVMDFAYAEQGDVMRRFDPLLWPDEQRGKPLAEENGLAFGWTEDVYPYSEAVRLMERVCGLTLDDEWMHRQRTAYRNR